MRRALITLTVIAIVTLVAVFIGGQMQYEQAIKVRAAAVEQYKAHVASLRANIVQARREVWIGNEIKGRLDLERNTADLGRLLVEAKTKTFGSEYIPSIQPHEIGVEFETEAAEAIRASQAADKK